MSENVISVHQILSVGDGNQRQIRFRKLKLPILFDDSSNTLRFCLTIYTVGQSKRNVLCGLRKEIGEEFKTKFCGQEPKR